MSVPHFAVPLNLPHAATIAGRISYHLDRICVPRAAIPPGDRVALSLKTQELVEVVAPYRLQDDNPPPEEAARVVAEAARRARALVSEIERLKLGDDRLGQAVRNFFECLKLGEEGARISLRAGENPDSALRPV